MALWYPFVLSALIALFMPLLTARARTSIGRWISDAKQYSPVPDEQIPDYLAAPQIDVYIEFAADLAQILPAVVLTFAGVVLALPSVTPVVTASLIAAAVLAVIGIEYYIQQQSPQQYATRRIWRYSFAAVAVFVLNIVAAAVVALI
jgi:hypothetical protein